ncbi:MAG: nickel-dependent hydrogenase large subunit, partial [Aquificaceae bacterium]|nr:nickel-dependent hydrogenase large subunit [Aquificaceae bacterium]
WELIRSLEVHTKKLIELLDQRSSSLKRLPQKVKGAGHSFVEAARGTLLHKIVIEDGLIKEYSIITPSQWNLGPRCKAYYGVAEKAIIGLRSKLHAQLVLRSFDVCSVCTTH